MKKQIAVVMGLLFALGTAAAGSLIYGSAKPEQVLSYNESTTAPLSAVAPETVEVWKATAASNDYLAPKAPI